jgi:hypothetical protein
VRAFLIIGVLALTGCDVAEQVADDAVRQTAENTIVSVVEKQFPSVNAQPIANCVVDNATTKEIFSIAGDSVTGVDSGTVSTVLDIIKRPDTVTCVAKNGLGSLLL